jgi:hypothetical protein
VQACDDVELLLPPDERRLDLLGDVDAEPSAGVDDLPDGNRLDLAFRFDRLRFSVVDRLLRRVKGDLVDEDRVLRRRGLEPRGGVDDVAGRHPLAHLRPSVQKHEHFAGRDADADLQLGFLPRPVADRERGADGPLRVVLVRGRRAEERHHRVADELLDRAAEALQLAADVVVVAAEEAAHVLGVERLRA